MPRADFSTALIVSSESWFTKTSPKGQGTGLSRSRGQRRRCGRPGRNGPGRWSGLCPGKRESPRCRSRACGRRESAPPGCTAGASATMSRSTSGRGSGVPRRSFPTTRRWSRCRRARADQDQQDSPGYQQPDSPGHGASFIPSERAHRSGFSLPGLVMRRADPCDPRR